MNATDPQNTQKHVMRAGLKEILWAPLTWAPMIPSMSVVALLTLPWWANTALLAAPAMFVMTYWKRAWPRLANVIRGKILLQQQQTDEADLFSLTHQISEMGYPSEARTLGKAYAVLGDISKLNHGGGATAQALRIEMVAREIYNQMVIKARSLLAEPAEKHGECLASFQKSLATMLDSQALLERQAEVIKGLSQTPEADRLANLQETLQTENTIGNQVIDRVQGDTKQSG